jgi:hypothetical protein
MARKRHSDEDILKLLREIEVQLSNGSDVHMTAWLLGEISHTTAPVTSSMIDNGGTLNEGSNVLPKKSLYLGAGCIFGDSRGAVFQGPLIELIPIW